MGSCLCKQKSQESVSPRLRATAIMPDSSESVPKRARIMEPEETIEQLIVNFMGYIIYAQDSMETDPPPLVEIMQAADSDEGWCDMMMGLVNTITMHDPLGSFVIAIVIDNCPLPARDIVRGFTQSLNLNVERCIRAYWSVDRARCERNRLFVLGWIAEKFGSPSSVDFLTEDILDYLVTFLIDERDPVLVLAALVALEKISTTAQNKTLVEAKLAHQLLHPLLPLELHYRSLKHAWRCVGFAARWALDNIFIFPGRKFSFETVEMNKINVILNVKDKSPYLKVSADGLEARCDAHTFESAKGTFEVKSGVWYYEVIVITGGVMQIGWAGKKTRFENQVRRFWTQEGYGVGDDEHSIAYDGCRRMIWHRARASGVQLLLPAWVPGDVLGCLIDTDRGVVTFSLNGFVLPSCQLDFLAAGEGLYPAASLMANQQCLFNFGARPFLYPPSDYPFNNMNSKAIILPKARLIIPQHLERKKQLVDDQPNERRCPICLDSEGNFGINPCRHSGFCSRCVLLLQGCPLCRSFVSDIYVESP